ncbi:MAG: 4Fe-4S dicluster domain-containing protein [Hyphomicrobiales bacterium]
MADFKRLLVCDCAGSMALEPEKLAVVAGAEGVTACSFLCTEQVQIAREALEESAANGSEILITCQQEASFFESLAEESHASDFLHTVDIRDRAGWTSDESAHAKQAALLAELSLERPATPAKDVVSEGVCLILGADDVAQNAAERLSDTLAVTCLLSETPDFASPIDSYDLCIGTISQASGTAGKFEVTVDGYAAMKRAGRGEPGFDAVKNGAKSQCDIILDLTGGNSLFPAPEKRDGYLRADPADPISVERAIFDASQLVGTFEKPLYIRFDPEICAHSRAQQSGCSRCLNVCPTGAIVPAGDVVSISDDICAGCGACAAVCPSGAASYDDPPVDFLFRRLRTLSSVYRDAGGVAPRVLFHDATHGAEMIRLSARFSRGLPANVIPVEVPNVEGVGHAELIAAMGVGFAEALVLMSPKADPATPEAQIEIARSILEGAGHNGDLVRLLNADMPETLEEILHDKPIEPIAIEPVLPLGNRRDVTRLASAALAPNADAPLPLPEGSPYGAVTIDNDACTLCLSCISLCPVGALTDHADRPAVNFQESACLQCGICKNTCPENAITLTPQLNISKQAIIPQVLHEEEPFECIDCGKPFGVKSTINRIVEKLEGKHWMYTNSDNSKLIQMCDDCRVRAQYHGNNSPFQMGERPKVRTTDDYLNGDPDERN